jgi:hypothetical protein
MSGQDSGSSSDYGWRESDGGKSPGASKLNKFIAAIIVLVLVSAFFWLKEVVPSNTTSEEAPPAESISD